MVRWVHADGTGANHEAVHLPDGTVGIFLLVETDKTETHRAPSLVRDNLGRADAWEPPEELLLENERRHLGGKVAHKHAVLLSIILGLRVAAEGDSEGGGAGIGGGSGSCHPGEYTPSGKVQRNECANRAG
jgi:hypothetical protein